MRVDEAVKNYAQNLVNLCTKRLGLAGIARVSSRLLPVGAPDAGMKFA
jgi:hypothetical protein